MEERSLFFETYPLGIINVSKIFTFITLAIGIIMAYLLSPWYLIAYLVGYILVLIYNIKYREAMCGYYGKTIQSKFGKIAQKFPPAVNAQTLEQDSPILVVISILSIGIIILPTIGPIYLMIINPTITGVIPALVIFYFVALLVPAAIFKRKIFPAYCAAK